MEELSEPPDLLRLPPDSFEEALLKARVRFFPLSRLRAVLRECLLAEEDEAALFPEEGPGLLGDRYDRDSFPDEFATTSSSSLLLIPASGTPT